MPSMASAITPPANIIHYVAITISNSQASAFPANSQIRIPFDALKYQQYETNSLNNINWFFANGTIIPSWLEGNVLNENQQTNLYTSSNIVYWLRIYPSNTMFGAGAANTIYVGFAGNVVTTANTMLDGVTTGEAPQISGTYSQYDNGNKIFPYYLKWGGLAALPTGWAANGGSTLTYGAASLTYKGVLNTCTAIYNALPAGFTIPYAMDFYGNTYGFGYSGTETGNGCAGTSYTIYSSDSNDGIGLGNNGGNLGLMTKLSGNVINTVSVLSSTSGNVAQNYGIPNSPGTLTSISQSAFVFQLNSNSLITSAVTIYWTRTHSLPPNNIQPSIIFFGAGAPTASNTTIDSGQKSLITSHPQGGTTPYTYNWFTGAACTSQIGGATSATYLASPISTTSYYYKVYDSAGASDCSSGVEVIVNPTLVFYSLYANLNPIYFNQIQDIVASVTGGTPPYNYNIHVFNSSEEVFSDTVSQDGTFLDYPYLQLADWKAGAFGVTLYVYDSASTYVEVSSSTNYDSFSTDLVVSSNTTSENYLRELILSNIFNESSGIEITSNATTVITGTLTLPGVPLPQPFSLTLVPGISPNVYLFNTYYESNVTISNLTTYTSANGYTSKVNNYPTVTLNSTGSKQLNIYLIANTLSQSYSISTHSCGVLDYGDFLYVYRGISTFRGNQTQSIRLQQIPTAIVLNSTYPYGFQLASPNGTVFYTSGFQIWNPSLAIDIRAPCSSVPTLKLPDSKASCRVGYNDSFSANTVTCIGNDTAGLVNSWQITLINDTGFSGFHTINVSNVISGNTLYWQYYPVYMDTPITWTVIDTWNNPDNLTQSFTGTLITPPVNGYYSDLNILLIILFLLVGIVAGSQIGTAQHKLSSTLFIEAFVVVMLYMSGLSAWLGVIFNGIIVMLLIIVGMMGMSKENGTVMSG